MSSRPSLWQKTKLFVWLAMEGKWWLPLSAPVVIIVAFSIFTGIMIIDPSIDPLWLWEGLAEIVAYSLLAGLFVVIVMLFNILTNCAAMQEFRRYSERDWKVELTTLEQRRAECLARIEDLETTKAAVEAERALRVRKLDKQLKYIGHSLERNAKRIQSIERELRIGRLMSPRK